MSKSHRMKTHGVLLPDKIDIFRDKMYTQLTTLGIEKHTPHDCRHTFSRLFEKYKVMENDRKRMLGHKIGDVTNDTYGHRTLEDLRNEIEKKKWICCKCVVNGSIILLKNHFFQIAFYAPKSPWLTRFLKFLCQPQESLKILRP